MIEITSPLTDDIIAGLKVGQKVYLSGIIYTARDAAHERIYNALKNGEDCGFDISGKTIYYAGPCPAKPGVPIGPIGPTTSGRMDMYTPFLIDYGLKVMIGKGIRNLDVKEAVKKNRAIYFAAIGGAAVVYMNCVKKAKIVTFEDLGTEAIRKLEVRQMPLIVALDIHGGDIYNKK